MTSFGMVRFGMMLAAAAWLFPVRIGQAQVTYDRLLNAGKEPQNWMTYSGSYNSWRYSALDQINKGNVDGLKVAWLLQMVTGHKIESTPIVVDGIMYVTDPPSNVFALDAATGRPFWHYTRPLPSTINVCCDQVNRGVAVLGDRVYLGTIDAHLVALDAKTGDVVWDVPVADYKKGYAITGAPLIVKDMVITGIAGGEYGVRGFLEAYDAKTGKRRWHFDTVPGPGQAGHETWPANGPNAGAWQRGGGPTWVTGSYDPELNYIIWGVGNPSPDWNAEVRPGDNLYTDSAIALDADTGQLKWHFQFVPHDSNDWDAVQVPVLVDSDWNGRQRKLIYWAHRGGFFYVLDRQTGEFLLGKPFAKQTWAGGLDAKGRPDRLPGSVPTEQGAVVWPGVQGATNWFSPSYSPITGWFYLTAWENKGFYLRGEPKYTPGNRYVGSVPDIDMPDDPGYGAIRALNPKTGEKIWEYKTETKPWSGVLTTAGHVLFGANGGWLSRTGRPMDEGYFFALDADTGKELWKINLGGAIASNPITYMVNGKQMVAMTAGGALFVFSR